MRKSHFLSCLLLIALLAACAPAAPTPIPAPTMIPTPVSGTLFVDPSVNLGPISPYIYGSNYSLDLAVSVAMLPATYDSGVTILRFPGGSWGDNNDVKTYQIDQIMALVGKMGASATINVRLKNGTPEKAAELVRYTNIEKKYKVKYWGIGNEPTLYDNELKRFGETYDVDRFNKEWREIALAMKKVDPSIKLIGPEVHQFSYTAKDHTSYDPTTAKEAESYLRGFIKANGDLVDVVSFHRYPFPNTDTSGAPTIAELRANTQEWDQDIIYLRSMIHEITGRDLPIAVTETNSNSRKMVGGEATPDSHFNAIWLADVLGRMIRNGVFMVNHWMLTSKGGYGGWGLVGQSEPFPSYYTYQMYKKFGTKLVYSSSPDPDLSIYAAKRTDGALTLVIINLANVEKQTPLTVQGQALTQAEHWLFDPAHKAENLGSLDLSGGALTLPPQSMTLLVLATK